MPADLATIQKFLETAQNAESFKADVKRSLRKVASLAQQLQNAVGDAEELLTGDYAPTARKSRTEPEKDADAPFGRRKDGTPKGKPGVPKQKPVAAE